MKRLNSKKLYGPEQFIGMNSNLLEYWSWAHSDIASNTERGKLAEYFVAKAVQAEAPCRVEWDEWDVTAKDKTKIEVKTSAYLQTWRQTKFSVIQFDIAPKRAWDRESNQFSGKMHRAADVYVFCLFACKNADKANLMDLNQWEFYVLGTHVLDSRVPRQKTISLKSLLSIGAKKTSYEQLQSEIIASKSRNRKDFYHG